MKEAERPCEQNWSKDALDLIDNIEKDKTISKSLVQIIFLINIMLKMMGCEII